MQLNSLYIRHRLHIFGLISCAFFAKHTFFIHLIRIKMSFVCEMHILSKVISALFFLLSDLTRTFLNRDVRGLRWLNAAPKARGQIFRWKCSICADHGWSRTGIVIGSSISFIWSSMIFLSRPLRGLRRQATSPRGSRSLSQYLPRSGLIPFCSQISLMVAFFGRWFIAWKNRGFFTVSASCRALFEEVWGGVDGSMVDDDGNYKILMGNFAKSPTPHGGDKSDCRSNPI